MSSNRAGAYDVSRDAGDRQEQRGGEPGRRRADRARPHLSKYESLRPVYTEYNVGHHRRSFALSNKIDQSKISAEWKDGVLTLVPKAQEAKARCIVVSQVDPAAREPTGPLFRRPCRIRHAA
jgi:hypothetical protein